MTLKVGNRKSVDNPFPAVATGKIRICCAVPSSLTMSSMRAAKNALPVCPAFSVSLWFYHLTVASNGMYSENNEGGRSG